MTQYLFYVYAYLRPNGSPYYIGKGKNKRAYSDNHIISVPEDKSRIVFLETNLSELGAFALERRYIKWYGRLDNNITGTLENRTDGGEGATGTIRVITNETRRKISEGQRGKSRPSLKGVPRTEEVKKRISESLRGRSIPEEVKKKLSAALKGIPLSDDHKKAVSKGMMGRVLSAETREKISKSHIGMISPMRGISRSKEVRKKISDALKGRKLSKEHIEKMSILRKGIKIGPRGPYRKKQNESNINIVNNEQSKGFVSLPQITM